MSQFLPSFLAAVPEGDLVSNLAGAVLMTLAAFAVMTLIASFIRFQQMAAQANATDPQSAPNENVFEVQIANRIGTVHRSPDPFSLVLIAPREMDRVAASKDEAAVDAFRRHVEAQVRAVTRKSTDLIYPHGDDKLTLLLSAGREDVTAIVQRMIEHASSNPHVREGQPAVSAAITAGVATFPENGSRVQVLVDSMEAALEGAKDHAVHMAPEQVLETSPDEDDEDEDAAVIQRGLVDQLTGVLREDKFWPAIQKYVARYRKEADPVAVILLDIDYLSKYNEHYGEHAGDEILKGIGELLQRDVREDDLIARFGGEEFIVCVGCGTQEALPIAQRIAADVKTTDFMFEGKQLKITVSAGIAGFPEHSGIPRDMLEFANAALVEAKARGRKMCVVYEPHMLKREVDEGLKDVF